MPSESVMLEGLVDAANINSIIDNPKLNGDYFTAILSPDGGGNFVTLIKKLTDDNSQDYYRNLAANLNAHGGPIRLEAKIHTGQITSSQGFKVYEIVSDVEITQSG